MIGMGGEEKNERIELLKLFRKTFLALYGEAASFPPYFVILDALALLSGLMYLPVLTVFRQAVFLLTTQLL